MTNATPIDSAYETIKQAIRVNSRLIGESLLPLGAYAVVELFEPPAESLGGVVLTDSTKGQDPQMLGRVLRIGKGQRDALNGVHLTPEVKAGDIVLLTRYSKVEAKVWGKTIATISSEADIMARVDMESLEAALQFADVTPAAVGADDPEAPDAEVYRAEGVDATVGKSAGGIFVVQSNQQEG